MSTGGLEQGAGSPCILNCPPAVRPSWRGTLSRAPRGRASTGAGGCACAGAASCPGWACPDRHGRPRGRGKQSPAGVPPRPARPPPSPPTMMLMVRPRSLPPHSPSLSSACLVVRYVGGIFILTSVDEVGWKQELDPKYLDVKYIGKGQSIRLQPVHRFAVNLANKAKLRAFHSGND